jgi:hypothetical protein
VACKIRYRQKIVSPKSQERTRAMTTIKCPQHMVKCSDCGRLIDYEEAETFYNQEYDDVFFYCSNCIDWDYLQDDDHSEAGE